MTRPSWASSAAVRVRPELADRRGRAQAVPDRATSSSETHPSTSPGVWLRLVALAAWPTLVAALLVVGAAAAGLGHLDLPAAEPTMESVIIVAQFARAATLQDVDVLIVGDSSALMGVDASLLSQRLGGRRVESLALIAWVGPEGQIQVAEHARCGTTTAPCR